MGDVLWSVHCVGAVRTLLRKFGVVWHNKRETLAVDNMPVQRVELQVGQNPSGAMFLLIESPSIRTWTHDIASSVRSMSDTGKLKVDHDSQSQRVHRESESDRRTNFAMYPAGTHDTAITPSPKSAIAPTKNTARKNARKQADPVSSPAP